MKIKMLLVAMVTFHLVFISGTLSAAGRAEVIPGEYIVKFNGQKNAQIFTAQFYEERNGRFMAKPMALKYGRFYDLKTDLGPFALFEVKARTPEEAKKKMIEVFFDHDQQRRTLSYKREIEYVEPNYRYRIMGGISQEDGKINQRLFGNPQGGKYGKYQASNFDGQVIPNDPLFSDLWGLSNNKYPGIDLNVLPAWELTKGNPEIKIAVIDTGIDYNHPDLRANIWVNRAEADGTQGVDDDDNGYIDDIYGYDFANEDGDPQDDVGHGTHCAGTIGAAHNNGLGVAGVMAEVKLMPVKFLGRNGGTTVGAIRAIDYATKMKVHVMSNSWGGGGYSQALKEAIERAGDLGIVFMAAAGNNYGNNDEHPSYPASYQVENIISVAAHQIDGTKAAFSNFGRETVHVSAPGMNIVSTVPNGQYAAYSGTSMATPHVSGLVGLVLSRKGIKSLMTMRDRLIQTSDQTSELESVSASGGHVNSYRALY